MTDKKFNAILAKNQIARNVRHYLNHREPLSAIQIINELRLIEKYLGEANQPSVDSIVNDEKGWL